MKVPLEPIPTEQIVLVEKERPRAEVRVHERGHAAGRDEHAGRASARLERAYPWLLGASTCLSAMLCWMYVTKPVIATVSAGSGADTLALVELAEDAAASSEVADGIEPRAGELVPSDTALPGTQAPASQQAGEGAVSPEAISPQRLAAEGAGGDAAAMSLGWEATNLRVQHILSADAGNGALEKIVINVPVLYETRTMRWTSADIVKARDVLSRLMLYERNLSNLRQEGQVLLKDWNELLEETVPAPSLRADSPSLPYNHGQGDQRGSLPRSSSAIKVEH